MVRFGLVKRWTRRKKHLLTFNYCLMTGRRKLHIRAIHKTYESTWWGFGSNLLIWIFASGRNKFSFHDSVIWFYYIALHFGCTEIQRAHVYFCMRQEYTSEGFWEFVVIVNMVFESYCLAFLHSTNYIAYITASHRWYSDDALSCATTHVCTSFQVPRKCLTLNEMCPKSAKYVQKSRTWNRISVHKNDLTR